MKVKFISVVLIVWAQHAWATDGLSDREVDNLHESEGFNELEDKFFSSSATTQSFWREIFEFTNDLLTPENQETWDDILQREMQKGNGIAGGIRG